MVKRNSQSTAAPMRQANEPCPQCGGAFVVDEQQRPETLIERHRENAAVPAVAARYAAQVEAKAAAHGLIHRCAICGYRDRFAAAPAAA